MYCGCTSKGEADALLSKHTPRATEELLLCMREEERKERDDGSPGISSVPPSHSPGARLSLLHWLAAWIVPTYSLNYVHVAQLTVVVKSTPKSVNSQFWFQFQLVNIRTDFWNQVPETEYPTGPGTGSGSINCVQPELGFT